MANHDNNRRAEKKRTETGPRWENHGEGDAPHVARARQGWKKIGTRSERRTGVMTGKVMRNKGNRKRYASTSKT